RRRVTQPRQADRYQQNTHKKGLLHGRGLYRNPWRVSTLSWHAAGVMPQEIRTLLIDDRESDADYVQGFLRQAGPEQTFRVDWESDPQHALGRLDSESFDLVLLDHQMPGTTGLELLPKIRERHRRLPVIMLTGQGNEQIAVEAMK